MPAKNETAEFLDLAAEDLGKVLASMRSLVKRLDALEPRIEELVKKERENA